MTQCARQAEQEAPKDSREKRHGQHKSHNRPLATIQREQMTWLHVSSERQRDNRGEPGREFED